MNVIVKKYIYEQMKLAKAKNTEVRQYEILDAMRKLNIDIPDYVNRKTLVDAVYNSSKCNVFLAYFQDRFMIPLIELAKFYDMSSKEIMKLSNAGIIKEQQINKLFYNLDSNPFYKKVFKLSALLYERNYLKNKYRELDDYDLNMQMEIENDQLTSVMNVLSDCFDINISKIDRAYGTSKDCGTCCIHMQARIK